MTSPPPAPTASAALLALRERFRASVVNTFTAFAAIAAQLAEAPDTPEVLEGLRRELHRVHGTAGTYGFTEASRLAARLEERAVLWAAEPALDVHQRSAIIEHFVAALRIAFDAEADAEPPSAGRRVLAVGIEPALAVALRAEGVLHATAVVTAGADDCTLAFLRANAPHAVVTAARHAAPVAAAAAALAIPVVVLGGGAGALPGNVTSAPEGANPAAVFDLAARAIVGATWRGATVLVVDDDPAVLALTSEALQSDDLRVLTLAEPARLFEVLIELRPSLLLMDVQMGDFDGVELTQALRATPVYEALPIILLSSASDADARTRAYEAGADEFIAKPIAPTEVRRRVAERLERRRLHCLAREVHPTTELPLPQRTAREAEAMVAAAETAGDGCALILVRPAAADERENAGWPAESLRIARAVERVGGMLGYDDDATLAAVVRGAHPSAALALGALAASRPAGAPEWRAALAHSAEVGACDFDTLRRAARDALAGEGTSAGAVRTWSRESARLAPDVVVVDEDAVLAELLQYAVRGAGYSCEVFDTGPAALDALVHMKTLGRRPLVLLDVDLPGMDGHSLHERLRLERPGAFGVVFATVHAGESEQLRALRAGAIDYVVKPFSLRVLMAKIPLWLERGGRAA